MYLFARLAERFAVEIVPGVYALAAASAASRLPLAARDDMLAVVPATLDEEALRARIAAADAVALVKVGRHLAKVRRVLEETGLAAAARCVEYATMDGERVRLLSEIADERVPYFSTVLVHRRGEAWR